MIQPIKINKIQEQCSSYTETARTTLIFCSFGRFKEEQGV